MTPDQAFSWLLVILFAGVSLPIATFGLLIAIRHVRLILDEIW